MKQLESAAKAKGITIVDRGNGHLQLTGGPLLVNYYPESKKRTAYVAGTTKKTVGVDPEKAIAMCFAAPVSQGKKDSRRKTYKSIKKNLYRKSKKCLWCKHVFPLDQMTLEHIIPLDRGGLDNENNMALACATCNHDRGNNMPELEKNQ